jgi:hypothetical protein
MLQREDGRDDELDRALVLGRVFLTRTCFIASLALFSVDGVAPGIYHSPLYSATKLQTHLFCWFLDGLAIFLHSA